MDPIQFIGYLSGFIISVALTPQVFQAWKTKSTKDISLPWTLSLLVGLLLYFIYGVGIKEMPIIVMNGLETSLVLALIVAKLIYK
ncbi:MAG: SemiSWEET family transporter [Candidatus Gracilibacteria bacterium]